MYATEIHSTKYRGSIAAPPRTCCFGCVAHRLTVGVPQGPHESFQTAGLGHQRRPLAAGGGKPSQAANAIATQDRVLALGRPRHHTCRRGPPSFISLGTRKPCALDHDPCPCSVQCTRVMTTWARTMAYLQTQLLFYVEQVQEPIPWSACMRILVHLQMS